MVEITEAMEIAAGEQLADILPAMHGAVLRQARLPKDQWEANRKDAYRRAAREVVRAALDAQEASQS